MNKLESHITWLLFGLIATAVAFGIAGYDSIAAIFMWGSIVVIVVVFVGLEILEIINHPDEVDVERDMPDKRLMYDSSVVDFEVDSSGDLTKVTLVEMWGKGSKRRARRRTLEPSDKEYVSGGGYSYKNHGCVIHGFQLYEIKEVSNERWWTSSLEWGERKEGVGQ